jgi:hypothetical protein
MSMSEASAADSVVPRPNHAVTGIGWARALRELVNETGRALEEVRRASL